MMWLFAVVAVLLLGVIAVVASGRGDPLEDVYDDRPDAVVPRDRRLSGADLRAVRFSLAFRGYRMSEVDSLLDRLARELEEPRDQPGAQPGDPDVSERRGGGNLG